MDNKQIYAIVLGQILRHFLTAAAALLAAYGVGDSQQAELVDTTVRLGVALIIFFVGQGLAYLSKRNAIFSIPPDYEVTDTEEKNEDS